MANYGTYAVGKAVRRSIGTVSTESSWAIPSNCSSAPPPHYVFAENLFRYSRYVGRVGALAVALGIGTAVATGLGAGPAYAETGSSGSASSPSSAEADSSSGADSADSDGSAVESGATSDGSESGSSGSSASSDESGSPEPAEADSDSDDLETMADDADDEADSSGADEPGGEAGQSGDALADDPAAEELPSSPTDSGAGEPVADAGSGADGGEEPSDGVTRAADAGESSRGSGTAVSTDQESPSTDDEQGAGDLDDIVAAGDAATDGDSEARSAEMTTRSAEEPSDTDTQTTPSAAAQAVSGPGELAAALLAPVVIPGPVAPAQPTMLIAMLAAVGRQIQRTFFNSTPIANDQTELIQLDDPDLANPIILDASDANDDTLSYTVAARGEAGGPSHGNVYIDQSTGSVVYAADEGFVGTDTFIYTVSDQTVGLRLYGLASTVRALLSGTPVYADTATVTIVVTGGEDPTAVDDLVTTDEDTAVGGNVLLNDTDIEAGAVAAVASGPTSGTVDLAADGTFQYTPNADFNGTDSFGYTVTTAAGEALSATVTVTVVPVNDAPIAADDAVLTSEGIPVGGGVLANDSDIDGDTLTAVLVSGPTSGGLVFTADGTFQYTPAVDFNGTDSFVYSIADTAGETDTATVTVTVVPASDAPTAVDDVVDTDEDTDVSGNVLLNDSGSDGPLIAALVDGPANGTVELRTDGTFEYRPDADFNGADAFTYTVIDADGDTATATVTVNVAAVNDAPSATDDAAATTEDGAVVGNVLLNDSDIDGGPLTAALVSGPANGTVSLSADGTFLYQPVADFNGTDSFDYEVADGGGLTRRATVLISVTPVNDGPSAVNDDVVTAEDTTAVGDVLANDFDPDGDMLTATLTLGPRNGTLTLNTDGTFQYAPNPDFHGLDAFSYSIADAAGETASATVIIDITAVDDAPIAVDDTATTQTGVAVGGNVLDNDSDPDGDVELTVALEQPPANGTVELNSDGTYTYVSVEGFVGIDTFGYTVTDPEDMSARATVLIEVTAGAVPVAVDDAVTSNEGDTVTISPLANDVNPAALALTVVVISDIGHGSLAVDPDDSNSFLYTPEAGFVGTDSFDYRVIDSNGVQSNTATVTITVTSGAGPVAVDDTASTTTDGVVNIDVLANDRADEGAQVMLVEGPGNGSVAQNTDGTFDYTPVAGFVGVDSFSYVVINLDSQQSAPATVRITVTSATSTATDDSVSTEENIPVSFDVRANDVIPAGVALTAMAISAPQGGELTVNADGTFQYVSVAGFVGMDSFDYVLVDANDEVQSNIATVLITVTPTDGPVVRDDTASTIEGQPVTIDVLSNDTFDADGAAVTISAPPDNGDVVENGDGTFAYTPESGFVGVDSFEYGIVINGDTVGVATVTVTVASATETPIANDDAVSVSEGDVVVIGVLENDLSPNGVALGAVLVTEPLNGTLEFDPADPEGTFRYTPDAGFTGADSFDYRVVNVLGVEGNVATVTITVSSAAVVIANDDAVSTTEGAPVPIDVLANDESLDGAALTAGLLSFPDVGDLELVGNGTFVYTPPAGFTGTDSFDYALLVGDEQAASATVTITVSAAVRGPVANDDTAVTTEGAPIDIDVLANDTVADPDAIAVTLVGTGTTAEGNAVSVNAEGTIGYAPSAGFVGGDTFGYVLADGDGVQSEVATVTVTVSAADPADAAAAAPADGDAAATDL